jgi:integrase
LGPQHVVDGEIVITRKKTDTPATITVLPELQAIIEATPLTGLTTFLITKSGRKYEPNDLSDQFRKWCDEAGLPPQYTLHGLRHAMGDALAERDATPNEIASVLAHKDVRSALHYTQEASRKKMARKAMARLIAGTKSDRSGNEGVSVENPPQTLSTKKA